MEHTFLFHMQLKLPSSNREKYYMYPWISNFRKTNSSPAPAAGKKMVRNSYYKPYGKELRQYVMWVEGAKDWVGKVPMRETRLPWALCLRWLTTVEATTSDCQLDRLICLNHKHFEKNNAFWAFAAIFKLYVLLVSTEIDITMTPWIWPDIFRNLTKVFSYLESES